MENPNKDFCAAFENGLRASPERVLDMMGGYVPGVKKSLANSAMGGNPFGG